MKTGRVIFSMVIVIAFLAFFASLPLSTALYKRKNIVQGDMISAIWNVSVNQTGVNNNLSVVPGTYNADYTLNLVNNSQVDVVYSVVLSGLPAGVEVSYNGGTFQQQDANNTISFTDIGTILYSAQNKNKTDTLTFRAVNGAAYINNKKIDVDVTMRQSLAGS